VFDVGKSIRFDTYLLFACLGRFVNDIERETPMSTLSIKIRHHFNSLTESQANKRNGASKGLRTTSPVQGTNTWTQIKSLVLPQDLIIHVLHVNLVSLSLSPQLFYLLTCLWSGHMQSLISDNDDYFSLFS